MIDDLLLNLWCFWVQIQFPRLLKSRPRFLEVQRKLNIVLSLLPPLNFQLQQLLKDLSVQVPSPPVLYCDNQSALQLARNPIFHGRTKHIEVDLHFVLEGVASQSLVLQFLPIVHQPVDLFTKALSTDRLLFLLAKLMPQSPFV